MISMPTGRVIIGITGASGLQYGVRAAQALSKSGFDVHTIVSDWAKKTAAAEGYSDFAANVRKYSKSVYDESAMGADISSSSFNVYGMIIIPCSIKTLGEIAAGIASNLVSRAALNMLRSRKRLVLVVRETPLGMIELENALRVTRAGGIILPASPAFYSHPKNVDDMVNFVVGKALDAMSIEHEIYPRWGKAKR